MCDTWKAKCHKACKGNACVTHCKPCVHMHGTWNGCKWDEDQFIEEESKKQEMKEKKREEKKR